MFKPEWNNKSRDSVFTQEIITKLNIINPDAIYYFNNQPFILFFDFTKNVEHNEKFIHRQVWCFDKAPLVFILTSNSINVYNAFKYQKETDNLEKLEIDNSQIFKQFSFWELESGNTWKWLEKTFYTKGKANNINKQRVNQVLFTNIKSARKELKRLNLEDEFANILILRLIFSRYLIDRGVIIDEGFINGATIEDKKNSFNNLIANKEKLSNYFMYLNDRFNGSLFKTENDNFEQIHLDYLSKVFSEDNKGQGFLFDIFDFSIIPVEVISGIYESVIDPEKKKLNSAVYTPPFFVEYILENTLAKFFQQESKIEAKVLDPACGSGIFLVQAYRRMVDQELKLKGKISDERLKEILENNIFGIDKDLNALNVAVFSMYVALLDYKNPKEINEFIIPNLLNKNFFEGDFFDEEAKFNKVLKTQELNFILGNPPWGSKKEEFHLKYIKKYNLDISNYEISQTFMFRTRDFAIKNTTCSLIVTSKAFHNDKVLKFKNSFLKHFFVDTIFDLSPVRKLVFEEAINPAIIIFFRFSKGEYTYDHIINHISVKSNLFLKYFKALVIEKQDNKCIKQGYFIDYNWMFKLALYGNTLDFYFIQNLLKSGRKLEEYINEDKEIFVGDGIQRGARKNEPHEFLRGLPIIERNEIKPYFTYVDEANIIKEKDLYLERGRVKEIFDGKHILIKKQTQNERDIIISYCGKPLVFINGTFGITSKNREANLKIFYGLFISKLYTYFQFLISSGWGVSTRPEISLTEYLSFPYNDGLKSDFISLVNKFLEPFEKFYLENQEFGEPEFPQTILEQINDRVNEAYKVDELEKDLINYVLDISRYQFQESKQDLINRIVKDDELINYADVFYQHFSEIYNEDNEYFAIDIYPMPYFSAINFKIVSEKPKQQDLISFPKQNITVEKLFKILSESLSIHNIIGNLFIQKDIKGFEEKSFYIIKPNEYKCWHRAIAHYDLGEFVEAIDKAEIEQF